MAKLSLAQLQTAITAYIASNKIAYNTFTVTRDNSAGLLDKVGKIVTMDTSFIDKLSIFDGEYMGLGKTIEEWQEDLILPQNYDKNGAGALSPHDPTYRAVSYSYTLGRKVIATTIRNNDFERAVNNIEEYSRLLAIKSKRLYDSEALFRFDAKKELLGKYAQACIFAQSTAINFAASGAIAENTYVKSGSEYGIVVKPITSTRTENSTWSLAKQNGYVIALDLSQVLAKPSDTATGEAFITQVKKDVEITEFPSEGHSLNGNTLGSDYGTVLIVKTGVMPELEVKVQAGAFNGDKVAMPTTIVRVNDFGATGDSNNVYAMLVDRRAIRLHNTYRAVRDNQNGDGDFLNLFLHTENTAYYSKNTFVKVYKSA